MWNRRKICRVEVRRDLVGARRRDETGSPARGKVRGLTVGGLGSILSRLLPSLVLVLFSLHFAHSFLPQTKLSPQCGIVFLSAWRAVRASTSRSLGSSFRSLSSTVSLHQRCPNHAICASRHFVAHPPTIHTPREILHSIPLFVGAAVSSISSRSSLNNK